MIACWFGCRPPPKKPWKARKMMSCGSDVAIPHRNENTVNMPRQIRK
jgi:hypothetical protein